MKPITYTNMSYSDAQRIRRKRKKEYAWEQTEKRLEESRKAWHDYCVRANAEYDALMAKTKDLMKINEKLSQQVTSKLV